MRRALLIIGAVVVIAAIGVGVYIWQTGSSTPSGELTAPTLAPQTASTTVFRIQSPGSEVRFIINEELMGQPTTVIGETDQVAGDIAVDFENPANSEIGTIRINMRDIATDNEFRNRALRSQILLTNEFEFAEFTATSISGLPETVTIGQAFDFSITGNLTVRGVTREVTFNTTVTPVSETEITGTARAEVLYADFQMTIPDVPSVANVTDEVQLEIDFSATATDSAAATPAS
jgi:polyisoprenoid-binding protein YceI